MTQNYVHHDDFGEFEVVRRTRSSAHIPQVVSLPLERMVGMFAGNEGVWMYRAHPTRLIVLELAEATLTKLDVSVLETVWDRFMEASGRDVLYELYHLLRDTIKAEDALKRAMIAIVPLTDAGKARIVVASNDIHIPENSQAASNFYKWVQMGVVEDLTTFYGQLLADDGMLLFDKDWRPYTVWQSGLDVITALLGYPYSLYLDAEPFNTDFWLQLHLTAPAVYNHAINRTHTRMRDINKVLRASALGLIDHEAGEKGEPDDTTSRAIVPVG